MKTIKQAESNIKNLKKLLYTWDCTDSDGFKRISKLIRIEEEFIEKETYNIKMRAVDEAFKSIKDLLKDFNKKYVYIVYETQNNVLLGCFDSREKAENYISLSNTCVVSKTEVI